MKGRVREWGLLGGLLALGLVTPPLVAMTVDVWTMGPDRIAMNGSYVLPGMLYYVNFYETLFWPGQIIARPVTPGLREAWFFPNGSGGYYPIGMVGAWLVVATPCVLVQLAKFLRSRVASR